ncbi:unnamed protein product [Dovyalis caffra]|uniref:Uncharacterized protein n=1 Tax=Dovyalis caffra TaxID=77055 RepID=A0AAV1QSE9_9ROSI|nr:unnamed protein product [Dovyalis caffra]
MYNTFPTLERISLRQRLKNMELDESEETTLHDVNIEEEMRRKQQAREEAYDEDEGMRHGGTAFIMAQYVTLDLEI